ncbi:MAG: hypothetical protein RLZZ595_1674 [Bacteroidota bacterium]|jgi:hypothetical protein
MRKIMIMCGAIFISMLFTQLAAAQDNNQSISEDLKKVWGDPGVPSGNGLNMDGMYGTQTDAEEDGPPVFDDNVLASTPIDGGISLLLAAGVVVGTRRIRREVNKSKDKENYLAK